MEFSNIGVPGNNPTHAGEADGLGPYPVGQVNYAYAISRTEVTTAQWAEFVNAYAPYYAGSSLDITFTGGVVQYQPGVGYTYPAAMANVPAAPSWYFAAKYVNWLDNGKASNAAAFQTGTYDTKTFGSDASSPIAELPGRLPGAQFALPSQDEWVKAAYYDPSRFGIGQGGYWQYPDRSDSPLASGLPGAPGAMTAAGVNSSAVLSIPVASYPDVQSAWGLFDLSGSRSEWTDTLSDPGYGRSRFYLGTSAGESLASYYDNIQWNASELPSQSPFYVGGFRVVEIPEPTVSLVMGTMVVADMQRRRKRCVCQGYRTRSFD